MNEMNFVFLFCKLQNLCCIEHFDIDTAFSHHSINFVVLIAGKRLKGKGHPCTGTEVR